MESCQPTSTLIFCGTKLSKLDDSKKIDPSLYRNLGGSLRYLTCTRPTILYGVGMISRYTKIYTLTNMKMVKRILRHVKCTLEYVLTYFSFTSYILYGYRNID